MLPLLLFDAAASDAATAAAAATFAPAAVCTTVPYVFELHLMAA